MSHFACLVLVEPCDDEQAIRVADDQMLSPFYQWRRVYPYKDYIVDGDHCRKGTGGRAVRVWCR